MKYKVKVVCYECGFEEIVEGIAEAGPLILDHKEEEGCSNVDWTSFQKH